MAKVNAVEFAEAIAATAPNNAAIISVRGKSGLETCTLL